MMWKYLADMTVVVHGVWVLAFVFGPIWAWKNSTARWAHLTLLWLTNLTLFSGYYCPLTLLETSLRLHYDPTTQYAQGFVANTVNRMASCNLTLSAVNGLIVVWTLLWTAVYLWLWLGRRKTSRSG